MPEKKILLEMKGITKAFPGVLALNSVNLSLECGEVLALLGENGAGKSTLLKILSGAYQADKGEILIQGRNEAIKAPLDAANLGISVIYQELNYLNDLTVAENIFLGRLPYNKLRLINWKRLNYEAKKALEYLGVQLDPTTQMKDLSTAQKQLVEIAKAISRNMKILVMDEPTSALSDSEAKKLIEIIKNLAANGIGVIYISHRIEELFLVSDRVQVLRDGSSIAVYDTRSTNRETLIKSMIGREVSEMYAKSRSTKPGSVVMEVEQLNGSFIKDINFSIHKGEILGIYGLMGSGRTKLCETLFGIEKRFSGTIKVDGQITDINSPGKAIKAGLAYVPSERKSEGLILIQSVRENFSTAILDKLKQVGLIKKKHEKRIARKWIEKLSISAPGIEAVIENLSGGNQQKVVIGKWLETKPKIIILNEPTRGIDVGAKAEIYAIIEKLCEQQMAVILVSSERSEIISMSDRVLVMCNGKLTGLLSANECNSEKLLQYAISR